MTIKFDVLGIGNAIVDVLSHVDDTFLTQNGIVKGSMQLIDIEQAVALYDKMGPAQEVSGGSCANTVAGIASFGGRAAFIGKVGNDQLGRVFTHDIRAAGVEFNNHAAQSGPETARCLVLVSHDGERSMNTYLGASIDLGPEDIEAELVTSAQIIYLEGYLWDPENAKKAFLRATGLARAAGREVSLSLSDPSCVERHRDSFLQLIRVDVDILLANEDEIKSLYQTDDFDTALQKVRQDCKLAALTRSAAGSVIVSNEEIHVIEAQSVDRVVDTTGAGDLFAAGFLYGYSQGTGLADCARLGALAAAEIITHMGARPLVNLNKLARENGYL